MITDLTGNDVSREHINLVTRGFIFTMWYKDHVWQRDHKAEWSTNTLYEHIFFPTTGQFTWKRGNCNIRIKTKNSKKSNLRKRMWQLKVWMLEGRGRGRNDLRG